MPTVVVLTIGGIAVDRVATNTALLELVPYAPGGVPTLSFGIRGFALADRLVSGHFADPWDGKEVTLTLNGTVYFKGNTGKHYDHNDNGVWCREWHCRGLLQRAEYIPVTDSNTLTDTAIFNRPGDDILKLPSRTGRTVGQILIDVLEISANSTALAAYGIGNYTSAGSGAAATCTVSGGVVQSTITVTNGGSSYGSSPPTVYFVGGGGSGATGTAVLTAGVVTSITRTAGGTGYKTAPIVLLSRLPAVTLADLVALTVITPQTAQVSGEYLLRACEQFAQVYHPNHWLHVDPSGNIRFLDNRTFSSSPITLTMGAGSRIDPARVSLTSDNYPSFGRLVLRGGTLVQAVSVDTTPPGAPYTDGGLVEWFQHDGLTNAQAKAAYKVTDYSNPTSNPGTARAHATVSGGVVTALVLDDGGYNYQAAPTVLIQGAGSGATATAAINGTGNVTGFTVTSGGSGYGATAPTIIITAPAQGNSDVGTCTCPNTTTIRVTSTNPGASWPANYWDQTSAGHLGNIIAYDPVISGVTAKFSARIVSNTALTPGGTCDIVVDNPLPATSYSSYQIYGLGGGASLVWRRYKLSNAAMAKAMQLFFPYEQAMPYADGSAATTTSTPVGFVTSPQGTTVTQNFSIDPDAGTITFAKPTSLVFSPDGTTLVIPTNVRAFLAVATGQLSVTVPPDISGVPQYTGTGYTWLGLTKTKTVTCLAWTDHSNSQNMTTWASEMLDSMKDIVIEGSVPLNGLLESVLTPGVSLNLAGDSYTTGLESIALPVVSPTLSFHESGGPIAFSTGIQVSNRRARYSGEAFERPMQRGNPLALITSDLSASGWAPGSQQSIEESANYQSQRAIGHGTSADVGYNAPDLSPSAAIPQGDNNAFSQQANLASNLSTMDAGSRSGAIEQAHQAGGWDIGNTEHVGGSATDVNTQYQQMMARITQDF